MRGFTKMHKRFSLGTSEAFGWKLRVNIGIRERALLSPSSFLLFVPEDSIDISFYYKSEPVNTFQIPIAKKIAHEGIDYFCSD